MGRAYLTFLPVILLWASMPLLVSELSRELPAAQINVLTGSFAVLMLALILGLSGRWRQFRAYSRKDYARMILLGLTGIFPYTSLYYLAFSLAPAEAGSINIMNYLWPVWILVLSSFILKEALSWRKVLGLLLSFCGVTLIVTGGLRLRLALGSLPAYLAAGCGAFFWALFSVLSKRYAFEPLSSMLLFNVAALPCFAAVALIAGALAHGALAPGALAPGGLKALWAMAPSPKAWLLLAFLGGCVNAFGYLFWILSLRRGDTARISNAVYLVPFVALVYLAAFGKGSITALQLLALILSGPLLQGLRTGR